MEVAPSPKLHDWLVMFPLELLLKLTVSGAVPEVGLAEKTATGAVWGAVTMMVRAAELLPPGPAIPRIAVKVPTVV